LHKLSDTLGDAGPHPNKAHAAWGRRAHRLEPDPATAPVVTWMFAQRLAGHSAARITRALNDAGMPCPSASDPARNPHRTGTGWTLAGLLTCGRCGRRLESAWSHDRPAYRCRHGHTSAAVPDPARPKTAYLREDEILPHLAALAILRAESGTPDRARQAGITAPAQIADFIDQLRADGVVLTYDPQDRTLRADGHDTLSVTIGKNH
jgi:hypothetical protein